MLATLLGGITAPRCTWSAFTSHYLICNQVYKHHVCSNVGDSAWRDYDLVVQLKCHILHVLFSISLTLLVSNNLQLSRSCFEAGSPALLHEFTYHSSVTFVWCKYKFQLQLRLFLPIWMWTQFLILKAVSFDVFFCMISIILSPPLIPCARGASYKILMYKSRNASFSLFIVHDCQPDVLSIFRL